MRTARLSEMTRGWFIGDFEPSLAVTGEVEVGVKTYKKGEKEPLHFHKVATEFTVVISGSVQIGGVKYCEGDIVVIEPYERVDFEAVTDSTTLVVKIPGVKNDKYVE